MINITQLRELVVRPTLSYLDPDIPYSEDAVELILMTYVHEGIVGNTTYLKQKNGPALSPFQMESVTYHDHWDNFLAYRPPLEDKLDKMLPQDGPVPPEKGMPLDLVTNLAFAVAMVRVHYYRVPEALPKRKAIKHPDQKDDWINAMAKYAKKYYNTELGKATWQDYAKAYKKYCQ